MKLKKFNFKNINSTNDQAIKIIKNTNYRSGIVITEKQKGGRGQYGKRWISFKGNLFVSIFFSFTKTKLSFKKLTKLNCLLVKNVISKFYKGKILIKSPNDLLINKKKISGILQETILSSDERFIIVGIGINLVKSPKIKNYPTINLFELIGVKITTNNISLKLKKAYEQFIPLISKTNIKNINKI